MASSAALSCTIRRALSLANSYVEKLRKDQSLRLRQIAAVFDDEQVSSGCTAVHVQDGVIITKLPARAGRRGPDPVGGTSC